MSARRWSGRARGDMPGSSGRGGAAEAPSAGERLHSNREPARRAAKVRPAGGAANPFDVTDLLRDRHLYDSANGGGEMRMLAAASVACLLAGFGPSYTPDSTNEQLQVGRYVMMKSS